MGRAIDQDNRLDDHERILDDHERKIKELEGVVEELSRGLMQTKQVRNIDLDDELTIHEEKVRKANTVAKKKTTKKKPVEVE